MNRICASSIDAAASDALVSACARCSVSSIATKKQMSNTTKIEFSIGKGALIHVSNTIMKQILRNSVTATRANQRKQ